MAEPPDFIGVGTHLGGSTWWARLLAGHPQISGPRGRSWALGYFEPFCTREMTGADVAAYRARFPGRAAGEIAGEWSDRYVLDAWIPPLLRRAAPDAKLLVLLRDPVERYRLQLSLRLGEPRPEGAPLYMTEDVHRGRYASQLRGLRAFFAPEQLLVLQLECCLRDPYTEYARTLRFLGVDASYVTRRLKGRRPDATGEVRAGRHVPPAVRRAVGLPVQVPVSLWPDIEASVRAELEPEVAELAAMVDDLDLSLWPSFAHLAGR